MKRSYNGTYTIEQDHYTLAIMYTYYSDDGDYFNPPEEDFEIIDIEYNGMDKFCNVKYINYFCTKH